MGAVDIQQERADQSKFLDDLFETSASLQSCFKVDSGAYYSRFAKRAKKLCGEGLRDGIAKFKGPKHFLDSLYVCSFGEFSEYAGLDYADKCTSGHPVLDAVSEKLRRDSRLSSFWKNEECSLLPRQISRIVYYSFLEYIKPIWETHKPSLAQ